MTRNGQPGGTPHRLSRTFFGREGGVESGPGFQHGAGDIEKAGGDRSQGSAMAVTSASEGGIFPAASGVMLNSDARPVVHGVGEPIMASASIGDAATFARGRDLAAWLRLGPRRVTTGGKPRLLGITKRGDKYLRKMLVQGARSAFPSLSKSPTALGAWLRGLLSRAHTNKVVVALAAKIARIIWALLRHKRAFESPIIMAN